MSGDDRPSDQPLFAPSAEREVADELSFHIAMRERELMRGGLSAAEAHAEALRRFGDITNIGDMCRRLAEERNRTMRRTEWTTELRHDLRFAARQLRRAPGFATLAVITLALGIGAATAIFSVVDAVLLRPLPYPAADRLVVPQMVNHAAGQLQAVTFADYEDWRDAGVFESLGVLRRQIVNVAGDTETEIVSAAQVTEDFFATLQVGPVLGGLFHAADFVPGTPRRAVLSYGLWQSRFGGDRELVGRRVEMGGVAVEIAGVLPPQLGFPADVNVWFPLQVPVERGADYGAGNYTFGAIARLAPGKPVHTAAAEVDAMAARVAADDPARRAGIGATATPLTDYVVGDTVSRTLWILLGAVAFVLLIGCVNVANLLLGRAAVRARELAIRAGLGASRGRLVRQLLTEGVVLALLGGALGVGLAAAGVRVLVSLAPAQIPRLNEAGVNATVLSFALLVSLTSALLFAVLPALRSTRGIAARAVAGAALRATGDAAARRRRHALVAAQLALSLVLLVGAGLLLRSFALLTSTDPGFDTARLLTVEVSLQGPRYAERVSRPPAFAELMRRIESIGGVQQASFVSSLPIGGGGFYLDRAFLPEGRAEPPAGDEVRAMWSNTGPRYFETMGIRLLRGRDFTDADHAQSTPVAIVNRAFARTMFGDDDPIGRRVRSWRDEDVYREIVGVVEDVRLFGAGDELRPLFYVPHAQDAWNAMAIVIRTAGEPTHVAGDVRRELRAFDHTVGLSSVNTMDQVFSASVAQSRFAAVLLGTFAVSALLLAVVGIYGVLSAAVAQRTREIGIRMAVGARRGQVLGMILQEAGAVVAVGLAVGLAGALLLTRLAQSLLYEVSATDPLTFAAVTVLLAAVAMTASLLPGRRAAAVDPMTTLRGE